MVDLFNQEIMPGQLVAIAYGVDLEIAIVDKVNNNNKRIDFIIRRYEFSARKMALCKHTKVQMSKDRCLILSDDKIQCVHPELLQEYHRRIIEGVNER